MMVMHHLDDVTLLRYASGDLDEAFSVVVASHVAMCAQCTDAARAAEEIGGELLEDIDATHISEGAFERLMQLIDEDGDAPDAIDAAIDHTGWGDVPAPLRRFVGPSLNKIRWGGILPGVGKHAIRLKSSCTSSLFMLKIAPGKSMPEHGHGGAEMTLILSGAYRDKLGRFGPGDIADLDENLEHKPVVEPGEPCVCLVATEGPTRFKSMIGRALQPLHGI